MTTPQTKANRLARALGLRGVLYLKREDLHPLGSHKGRSIPAMIEHYQKLGLKDFCISSSGNAALAAARAIAAYNKKHVKAMTLVIFAGKKIDAAKLSALKRIAVKDANITVKKVDNPKQSAFRLGQKGEAQNLRQSTDDAALAGYAGLARELAKIKKLSAVFIPTSSGTAAQGLHIAFSQLGLNPQIHVVQTAAVHPIADYANGTRTLNAAYSLASAIVDRIGHRKQEVAAAIHESKGAAWIAADDEIRDAMRLARRTQKISVSPNSALSLAGLSMAIKKGLAFGGPVVCILSGK